MRIGVEFDFGPNTIPAIALSQQRPIEDAIAQDLAQLFEADIKFWQFDVIPENQRNKFPILRIELQRSPPGDLLLQAKVVKGAGESVVNKNDPWTMFTLQQLVLSSAPPVSAWKQLIHNFLDHRLKDKDNFQAFCNGLNDLEVAKVEKKNADLILLVDLSKGMRLSRSEFAITAVGATKFVVVGVGAYSLPPSDGILLQPAAGVALPQVSDWRKATVHLSCFNEPDEGNDDVSDATTTSPRVTN
jgi:hypothetical protein